MDNCPLDVELTVTPAMPSVFSAVFRSFTYWANDSPTVTVGAVVVAVMPVAVNPVIVRLVVESTVAIELPLVPN